jgi:iron complex transport system substrate-binding protein
MPGVRPWKTLALVLAVAACRAGEGEARPDPTGSRTFLDADGREVRLAVPVRRVVSLVPSATLTLDAIGARDVLVARTDFDTASWAASLPSVGGGLEPSIETIVALRPDLVIRFGGPQDARTPARLDELGIPHMSIRPDDIEDVFSTIRLLGRVTGRDGAADSLVTRLRRELDAVRQRAEGLPPVRTAYVLGGDPPWVAGPGTYVDEIIRLAGGVNVFSDLGSLYAAVSPEEMVARDIDVVLLQKGSTFDRRLVDGAHIVEVGGALELPGPAVVEAAREVAHALRGSP